MFEKLALGLAQIGSNYGIANKAGQPSGLQAAEIIHKAISAGIKFLDTAQAYGNSEEVLGAALNGIHPDHVTISTKLSPNISDNITSITELNHKVDQLIQLSLDAIGLKRIDNLMLHRWIHFSAHDGAIWKRLLYWQEKGVIGSLGASLVSPEEVLQAAVEPTVKFIQFPFNVLDRRFRTNEIRNALSTRDNLHVQVRSAYLQGLLVSDSEIWPIIEGLDQQNIIDELNRMVKDFGRLNRADLCLAYLRSLDWIDSVVIGMETLLQLNDNIKLFEQPTLSTIQIEIIEKTFVNCPEMLLNPSLWSKK